jgi:hypothetical protein
MFFPEEVHLHSGLVFAEIVMASGFVDLFLLFALSPYSVFSQPPLAKSIQDFFISGLFHQVDPPFFDFLLSGGHILPLVDNLLFGHGKVTPGGKEIV